MPEFTILLIDDEPSQVTSIKAFLKRRDFQVLTAPSGTVGLSMVEENRVDLVLTDFRMPDMNGLEVVKGIKQQNPEIPVVVVTAFSDTRDAVEVMKEGAFDYLSKPIDLDELEILVQKAIELNYLKSENRQLREALKERFSFDAIISRSNEMEEVLNTAGRVASSKATVLIRGESGTGKELVAKAVHFASKRSGKALITINCAALSESLLESELFGHEKGAFTGAMAQHAGRFEMADGGTLFIDEIGDMPMPVQVKLLRALQFSEFERVGGNRTLKVDVRVIAATNRPLETMIREGLFREDLFYRINVVSILLPPLRERRTDIPPLIRHFISRFAGESGKIVSDISREAHDMLIKYDYPGNIRELENIMERAIALARGNSITTADLPPDLILNQEVGLLDPDNLQMPYAEKVGAFEKALLTRALEQAEGNQSRAARLLNMSERQFRSRMQRLHMVNTHKSQQA